MGNIAVVSAGSFGTALAYVLSLNGYHINLHVRETDTFTEIDKRGANSTYLPNVKLNKDLIHPTTKLSESVQGAEFVLLAVPTQFASETMENFRQYLKIGAIVILTSKGLIENGVTMSEIASQVLPGSKVCGLYGITFSQLIVGVKGFSSMCIASPNEPVAKTVAQLFTGDSKTKNFRIHLSTDLRGAELGGAMKNVYAIAMGIFDGYLEQEYANEGEASRHSLLSLCMMEFVRLGLAHGAKIGTLLGSSGVGDIQASSNKLSRNYRYGYWMATLEKDENPKAAPALHEGYDTVKAALQLANKYNIDTYTPILKAIHDILFTNKEVKNVVPGLLKKLAVTIDANEEDKLNKQLIKPIKPQTKPITFKPEKKNKIAFVSYRFTDAYNKYMKSLNGICELFDIECTTGESTGPKRAGEGISSHIVNCIKKADLYIGIFLNDNSDKQWLIVERTCAINLKKPMLIFVETGTPTKRISKFYPEHPYYQFTKDTFASVVEKQLRNVDWQKMKTT